MTLPDIGATGIICLVVLAFAVIGFIKGLIRTVLAMVCLAIAGYAALWGNEHASDLTVPWLESPGPWLPKIIAAVTGLVVFFICRYILHFIVNPFNHSKTGKRLGFGLPAALISLATGLVILWAAFSGIRHIGSLSELRQTRYLTLGAQEKGRILAAEPWLLKAKRSLDSSSVGKWQRATDPFHSPGRLTLCRLLIMYQHTQTRVKMLTIPEIHRVLNNPIFIKLAFDQTMKNTFQSGKPKEIFQHPEILNALTQKRLEEDLTALPESLLTSVSQEDPL